MKKTIWIVGAVLLTLAGNAGSFRRACQPIERTDEGVSEAVRAAPLFRKSIAFIGDSYVQNHKRPIEETWHYRLAEKYQMDYSNFGRNGNDVVLDRVDGKNWGANVCVRFGELPPADYIVVIGGHNDAGQIGHYADGAARFKEGLRQFCRSLKKRYPASRLVYVTPWDVHRAGFPEVLAAIREVVPAEGMALYDAAKDSGLDPNDKTDGKAALWQGPTDTAHLSYKGHTRMLEKMEPFFLGLGPVAAAAEWPAVTKEMKPWAYNWWMGSAVDAAGLAMQVAEMEKVGMGGFHVIPIYSVQDNPADKPLLSPAWRTAFGDAVRLANERGLGVDLTTGSGWCFGGPQLAPEEGSWMLELNSKRLGQPDVKVLWEGVGADGQPVVLSARPTGQQVKRSGPGAHGPMMNPLSAGAMASFLKPFTAAFDAPGAAKPEHMYHDSYEYYSAGWSWELPAAFKARRGYDLADHYAELAGVGDPEAVARVKADYRETMSEMMVEDVFAQWQDWCAARGIATRNEAHGAPANWLDFYALADIPETEMFSCDKAKAQQPAIEAGFLNSGDRDVVVSKFASSAAHVKHAGAARDPLVSAESCTWVCEHFCETLGAVKTFVDRLFLAGVNHLFYHGLCYSPADARWPGWTFYATCEMNRFNPIWRDADILNAYITRVQAVAQTTAIDNDVLVYWPIHDFWHDAAGFEKQMTVHARDWLGGQPIGRVARALYDEGYSFDFISEKQLMTLAAPEATHYTTLVVPGATHMKVATLARFFALAEAGYRVLFVDGFPTTVPGFKDVADGERELAALVKNHPANVVAGRLGDLIRAAPARPEPFNKQAGLMYTRHKKDGTTYYFIANQYRNAGVKGAFKPSAPCAGAQLMDPLTGRIERVPVTDGAVELDLPIGHSVILAVTGEPQEVVAREEAKVQSVALDGAWTRTAVAGGPELPEAKTGSLPLAWGKTAAFPECAFAGTMRYVTKVTLDEIRGKTAVLDLGTVRESAKVYVNGVFAGGVILAPWRVEFAASLLKPGENEIAVEVTSTGANRLKWLDTAKPYAWKVFTDINMVDINYKKFDASGWRQHEAGLYGPVRLFVDAAAAAPTDS